jgi:hypothetical protein
MFWLKPLKIALRNVNEIWEKWPKLNLILAPKSVKLKENDLSLIFHDESWFYLLQRNSKNSYSIKSNKKALFSQSFNKKKLWNPISYQVKSEKEPIFHWYCAGKLKISVLCQTKLKKKFLAHLFKGNLQIW